MQRVLILGGSFNPMHDGHIYVAKVALKILNEKKIYFLPAKHNPFKKLQQMPSFENRLQGCRQKILQSRLPKHKFVVSNAEAISKSYETYFVLSDIEKTLFAKNKKITWIMGLDSLKNFNRWERWQDFTHKYDIVIVARGDTKEKIKILNSTTVKILRGKICYNHLLYKSGIMFVDGKNINISSTTIRRQHFVNGNSSIAIENIYNFNKPICDFIK